MLVVGYNVGNIVLFNSIKHLVRQVVMKME